MTWSKKHLRYKKLINKENWFENIVGSIQDKLTAQQLRRLKILDKDETYDLWDQIFLRCIDNRYWVASKKEEVLKQVDRFLDKYSFLLNSKLDNDKVRHIFMKSLMDVISVGSGLFFASEDYFFISFIHRNMHKSGGIRRCLFRLWGYLRQDFVKVCQSIGYKYPSIPKTTIYNIAAVVAEINQRDYRSCHLNEMMAISYGYAFWRLLRKKKIDPKKFEEEFLRKSRWYLESLSQCNELFLNKYKDKVFKELSSALGMDTDRSYFVYISFLKELEGDKYKDKNDLSEFISGLFSEEELKLFELKDVRGNAWNFQEQIKDRYYSKYPSFVSIEEIEGHVRKKVEEYRALLNRETVEIIRDVMLDEIERECFVSQTTYLWNQEMEKNLREGSHKCSKKIAKAIDLLVSMIPSNSVEQLSMEINGRVFNLKEQLMCRWNKAWFGRSLKDFQEHLSQLHIHTPYNFGCWKDKEKVSRIDLQTLLEEIDMFFLYPQKWRIIKKLMSRVDNGRLTGSANMERVKIAQKGKSFYKFYSRHQIMTIFLLAIFVFGLHLCFY